MFNLIIAVISIALIAAMAAASLYYGGDSFSASSARAEVATLINQGQQVSGASALFRIENSGNSVATTDPACSLGTLSACAINRLVDGGFLQAIPKFPTDIAVQPDQIAAVEVAFAEAPGTFSWMNRWTVSDGGDLARIFLNETVRDQICAEVERQGGQEPAPMTGLDAAGFGLAGETGAPYRCADLILGPNEIVTAFGFRL
jgi:hypothetical protein